MGAAGPTIPWCRAGGVRYALSEVFPPPPRGNARIGVMSRNSNRVYKGVVRNGTVILGSDCRLPEGTPVEVRPEPAPKGAPGAVLAAAKASPHVDESAVKELMAKVREGKRPVRFDSTLD